MKTDCIMHTLVRHIIENIALPDNYAEYVALAHKGIDMGPHLDEVTSLTDDDMEAWVNALVASYGEDPHRTHLLAMTFFHHLFTPERSDTLHRRYWPALDEVMTPFTRILASGQPVLMALLNDTLQRTNMYHLTSWETRYGQLFLDEALTLPLNSQDETTYMRMVGHLTAHVRMAYPAYQMRPVLTLLQMEQRGESTAFMEGLASHPGFRDAYKRYGKSVTLPDDVTIEIDDDARVTFLGTQFHQMLPLAEALKPDQADDTEWLEAFSLEFTDFVQNITVPFFMDFTLDMQAQFITVWADKVLHLSPDVLNQALERIQTTPALMEAVQRAQQDMQS